MAKKLAEKGKIPKREDVSTRKEGTKYVIKIRDPRTGRIVIRHIYARNSKSWVFKKVKTNGTGPRRK